MKNTLVLYETLQASRSFNMRHFALAATLSIAVFSFAGCRSPVQVQKENADQLTAKMLDASAEYRRVCQTPSDAVSKAAVHDALGSTTSAQQKAHFDQAQAESKARLASPVCQQLAAKRDAIGTKLNAVLKQGAPQ